MDISKITRVRGMKKRAVYMYLAMCLALALSVTGCSKKTVSSDGVRTVEKDYTKGQIMVVAATERNRYQNIYTSQLWSVKADDSGATFEEKLLGQIEQFLIELGTTNLMADEQGIELTGQEKDSLKALAKEYYRGLSEQDRDYMGVTESEVYDLYCEYYRADKLVAELTRDENLEVSDAEAKVIQVQQLVLDSRERAEDILSQVQQENADFANIASRSSRDVQINHTMEWSSDMDIREEAAFTLEQDEISDILEQDGKYYVLKCTNAYDEEATAARKSMLAQEKKTKAFLAIYEPFVRKHTVKLKDNLEEIVDFSKGQGCTSDNFFQMYHNYFTVR